MRALLIFALALIIALPAQAQDKDFNLLRDLPEGTTLVNLSATERTEVDQDLLITQLNYKSENHDPRELQNDINGIMTKALDMAKRYKDVKAITQQYHVYQYDRSRGKGARRDMVWAGQQGLTLKGRNSEQLLKLAGDLQETGLTMTSLSYTVSPELLEETRNQLLEAALKKLRTKASRTAKAIGKSKSELLQINVDTGNFYRMPTHHRGMAMEAGIAKMDMAAPVAAPGESQVTLTVNAQALLK